MKPYQPNARPQNIFLEELADTNEADSFLGIHIKLPAIGKKAKARRALQKQAADMAKEDATFTNLKYNTDRVGDVINTPALDQTSTPITRAANSSNGGLLRMGENFLSSIINKNSGGNNYPTQRTAPIYQTPPTQYAPPAAPEKSNTDNSGQDNGAAIVNVKDNTMVFVAIAAVGLILILKK